VLIVLAYDLSPSAARAGALIAHTPWPADTVVCIVTSPAGVAVGSSSFAGLDQVRAHDRARRTMIQSAQADLAQVLIQAGLKVETVVTRGRPASSIARAARTLEADLLIAGAKRHGAIAATLLGSVSSEIIERAHCSVLIARGTAFRRVLLATDGSPTSSLASDVLASWPMFADAQLRVVGVAAPPPTYGETVLSAGDVQAAHGGSLASSMAETEEIVLAATQDLARTHPDVERQVRVGDPGREIVTAAQEWAADLVVLGSDQAPSRRGLLLGSVARHVLHGIESSAFVVRSTA
jgi:nucleotide-binding universal stress UspA family protein